MTGNRSSTIYPLAALRAVVLHVQSLTASNDAVPPATAETINALARALGYLQIDTLNVIKRAHYVTLWARFGAYDVGELNRLIYDPAQRTLYEGWGHAASIIPLEHYRYHRWRTDPKYSYNPTFTEWLKSKANRKLAEQTLARIRSEGALRVSEFKYDGPQRGVWYDWSPPKRALEALFARGDLMVADRVNFHRVYDVKERVLPAWVDATPVSGEEARRFCVEQAARALGIFDLRHLTFYAYMRAKPVSAEVKALLKDGTLVEISGESMNGTRKWLVHRDNLGLLQRAADGEIRAARTTFLAPFDSLFWAPGRDELLWGFEQILECYKPAPARIYGYFSLPILHKDRLVGRFDPKLDRKSGVLHLNALFLEPGVELDEELIAGIAASMRDFLLWHGATKLKIVKSVPAAFGRKLVKAL